jgi:hypothetical protein
MKELTSEETIYLRGGHEQLLKLLNDHHEGGTGAPAPGQTADEKLRERDRAHAKIVELQRSDRLKQLVEEIARAQIAGVEEAATEAFRPFFDCPHRCKRHAQETDAFRAATGRLSRFQAGDLTGAQAAVEILNRYFGE